MIELKPTPCAAFGVLVTPSYMSSPSAPSTQPAEKAEERWNALFRASRSWRLAWNIDQLLDRVARDAVELLGLERAVAFLLERSGPAPRAVWPESAREDAAFLGKKPPRPGKLWPHPLWRPEWRLWLALWLEARGRKNEAAAVARASIDARFGLTHSQPALNELVRRCEG